MIKVDRLVDNRSGYTVIDCERGFFDQCGDSDGLGEADPDVFTIVELDLPDLSMADCFEWVDYQEHDKLGKPVFDERSGLPEILQKRVPKKKYDIKRLKLPEHRRIPSALLNKANENCLKTINVADYEADYAAEQVKHDTMLNANLTVGTSKTYATISAAYTASSSGDTIAVYATALGYYAEAVAGDKSITIAGFIANAGVIVQQSSGSVFNLGVTAKVSICNITARGSGGTAGFGFLVQSFGHRIADCVAYNCDFGFRPVSAGRTENCLAYDCPTSGFHFTQLEPTIEWCTAVDCGIGIRLETNTNCGFCRSIANTTDYFQGLAIRCVNNISSDGTEPGSGGSASGATTDFTNYAGDDFTLNVATALSLKGTPCIKTDAAGNLRKTNETDNDIWPGHNDPDPAGALVVPSKPTIGTIVIASTQLTIPVTVATAGDVVYARVRKDTVEAWSAQSESFKVTGSGNIVYTGLDDDSRYEVGIYAKLSNLTSDWDTAFAIPTAGIAVATTKLAAMYKAANTILLASTNLLTWIQSVNGAESTTGHVFLGYVPQNNPKNVETHGPMVRVTVGGHTSINDQAAKNYVDHVIVSLHFSWHRGRLGTDNGIAELNYLSDIIGEFGDAGITLDGTFGGLVESITSGALYEQTTVHNRNVVTAQYDLSILFPIEH